MDYFANMSAMISMILAQAEWNCMMADNYRRRINLLVAQQNLSRQDEGLRTASENHRQIQNSNSGSNTRPIKETVKQPKCQGKPQKSEAIGEKKELYKAPEHSRQIPNATVTSNTKESVRQTNHSTRMSKDSKSQKLSSETARSVREELNTRVLYSRKIIANHRDRLALKRKVQQTTPPISTEPEKPCKPTNPLNPKQIEVTSKNPVDSRPNSSHQGHRNEINNGSLSNFLKRKVVDDVRDEELLDFQDGKKRLKCSTPKKERSDKRTTNVHDFLEVVLKEDNTAFVLKSASKMAEIEGNEDCQSNDVGRYSDTDTSREEWEPNTDPDHLERVEQHRRNVDKLIEEYGSSYRVPVTLLVRPDSPPKPKKLRKGYRKVDKQIDGFVVGNIIARHEALMHLKMGDGRSQSALDRLPIGNPSGVPSKMQKLG